MAELGLSLSVAVRLHFPPSISGALNSPDAVSRRCGSSASRRFPRSSGPRSRATVSGSTFAVPVRETSRRPSTLAEAEMSAEPVMVCDWNSSSVRLCLLSVTLSPMGIRRSALMLSFALSSPPTFASSSPLPNMRT